MVLPKEVKKMHERLVAMHPVVECITNMVTVNDCANILLAVGASPTMAHHPMEVEEIATGVDALVLNMGAVADFDAMLLAGKTAKKNGHPVVIDPVGVAASSYRRQKCLDLIREIHPDGIRGNRSEIWALMKDQSMAKGVDSGKLPKEALLIREMQAYAKKEQRIMIASGAVDVITDGKDVVTCDKGAVLMTRITGAGCMSTTLLAPFLCVSNSLEGAYASVTLMGLAAEEAERRTMEKDGGTLTFRTELIDAISRLI